MCVLVVLVLSLVLLELFGSCRNVWYNVRAILEDLEHVLHRLIEIHSYSCISGGFIAIATPYHETCKEFRWLDD